MITVFQLLRDRERRRTDRGATRGRDCDLSRLRQCRHNRRYLLVAIYCEARCFGAEFHQRRLRQADSLNGDRSSHRSAGGTERSDHRRDEEVSIAGQVSRSCGHGHGAVFRAVRDRRCQECVGDNGEGCRGPVPCESAVVALSSPCPVQ